MIRGENGLITEDWEAAALAQITRKSGNQNVRVKQIPDAGHDCMQNSDEMLKEIIHMLTTWSKDSVYLNAAQTTWQTISNNFVS